MGGARWNSRDWKGPKPAGPAALSLPPAPPPAATPPAPPILAPERAAAPAPTLTRKKSPQAGEVRKRRQKAVAEAAAAALDEGSQVYYHEGTGISTLNVVRFFNLSPTQKQRLIDYAARELNARPC